jgi:tRNA A58 N-methylase Trm61
MAPYVRNGMTVLEPGPGMGFFTLELARMVGPSGRVLTVDIQPRMLDRLKRRAAHAGLLDRLDIRVAQRDSLGLAGAAGTVDFVLAFAMVHEMPSAKSFFQEAAQAMKAGIRGAGGPARVGSSGHSPQSRGSADEIRVAHA